jgi:hypothetical protein
MAETPRFAPVHSAIEKGIAKLQKWYKSFGKSDTYFITLGLFLFDYILKCTDIFLGLHPAVKLDYCKKKWDQEEYDSAYLGLEKTVCLFISSRLLAHP